MARDEPTYEMDEVRYFSNGTPMFYGRNGEPISLRQWADMYEDFARRKVAEDHVGDTRILTVWLGTDDDPLDGGPPLIFGSAVFLGKEFQEERRSSTEEEARRTHEQLVAEAKAARGW